MPAKPDGNMGPRYLKPTEDTTFLGARAFSACASILRFGMLMILSLAPRPSQHAARADRARCCARSGPTGSPCIRLDRRHDERDPDRARRSAAPVAWTSRAGQSWRAWVVLVLVTVAAYTWPCAPRYPLPQRVGPRGALGPCWPTD